MHSTTMKQSQRAELVGILSSAPISLSIQRLAILNDLQIYEQWLFLCQRGGYNHLAHPLAGEPSGEPLAGDR